MEVALNGFKISIVNDLDILENMWKLTVPVNCSLYVHDT